MLKDKIEKLESSDLGRWVECRAIVMHKTKIKQKTKRKAGRIYRYNNTTKMCYVVFECGDEWDLYKDYESEEISYSKIGFKGINY